MEQNIHVQYDEPFVMSILQCSERFKNVKTIKFLLDHGADVHAQDDAALSHFCRNRPFYDPIPHLKLLLDTAAKAHRYYKRTLIRELEVARKPLAPHLVFLEEYVRVNGSVLLDDPPVKEIVPHSISYMHDIKDTINSFAQFTLIDMINRPEMMVRFGYGPDIFKEQHISLNHRSALRSFVFQPHNKPCLWGITLKNLKDNLDGAEIIFAAANKANVIVPPTKAIFCVTDTKPIPTLMDDIFFQAVSKNYINTVRLMIIKKINVTTQNDQALITAVSHLNFDMTRLLLNNGANVNAKNGTALETVLRSVNSYPKAALKIAELLLQFGADIHINNDSILFHFCENGVPNDRGRKDSPFIQIMLLLKSAKEKRAYYLKSVILAALKKWKKRTRTRQKQDIDRILDFVHRDRDFFH